MTQPTTTASQSDGRTTATGLRIQGRQAIERVRPLNGKVHAAPSPTTRPGGLPTAVPATDTPQADPGPGTWEGLVPRSGYARWGKRVVSWALLVLSLPLGLLLAVPIALVNWAIFRDARSILYRQPRVGLRGRTFSIFKFRTMRETPRDEFDSWKGGHDGLRVTGFGRFLRNTHLDELPQLLNVLRGEMDFIGPRPEMIEIDAWARENVPNFRQRTALLPGITGYAQVTQGYAGMDAWAYRRKLAADRFYCANLSLRLDFEILARTVLWMARGRGWRWQGGGRPPVAATGEERSERVGESSTA